MGTLQRIKEYIDYKGITNKEFEQNVGFSNGAFSSQLKRNRTIGVDKLENILSFYPEINIEWLLTGQGEMLKTKHTENILKKNEDKNEDKNRQKRKIQKTSSNQGAKENSNYESKEIEKYQGVLRKLKYAENIAFSNTGAPYYDEAVSAGLTLLTDTPTIPSGFIDIPGVNSIAYFPVAGVSFTPIINPGDIIGVDFLDSWEVLDPDAIYYIITAHNRMIKHLMNDPDDETQLICISTNHKEFRIDRDDIKKIYRVVFYGRLL